MQSPINIESVHFNQNRKYFSYFFFVNWPNFLCRCNVFIALCVSLRANSLSTRGYNFNIVDCDKKSLDIDANYLIRRQKSVFKELYIRHEAAVRRVPSGGSRSWLHIVIDQPRKFICAWTFEKFLNFFQHFADESSSNFFYFQVSRRKFK